MALCGQLALEEAVDLSKDSLSQWFSTSGIWPLREPSQFFKGR
jgi:hypothetical protein